MPGVYCHNDDKDGNIVVMLMTMLMSSFRHKGHIFVNHLVD